ncbi:MAG: NusG domain II-containing protein [Clostridiaceae bacterium]|nr:NusG domain II-containing protein [Clostridiaceae bacterium]
MLKKGDLIIAVVILIFVLGSFIGVTIYKGSNSGERKIAVIKQGDRVIGRFNLDTISKPQEIDVSSEYKEVIIVERGRIRFKEADCPDRVCVKTGWLTSKGDMAVCLPNRVMVKIEGESDEVDIVTY